MRWFVYLVRCRDGSLYTGITTDPASRLRAHNAGRGAKYTRMRGPVTLVHVEAAGGRGRALRREWTIKRWRRAAKERLVAAGFIGARGGGGRGTAELGTKPRGRSDGADAAGRRSDTGRGEGAALPVRTQRRRRRAERQ